MFDHCWLTQKFEHKQAAEDVHLNKLRLKLNKLFTGLDFMPSSMLFENLLTCERLSWRAGLPP